MRLPRLVGGVLLAAVAGSANAQGPASCAPALRDACQKADDVYSYLFPQLGTALAGGHPTLGASGILGGLGKFSVGVRATGVLGSLPDLDAVPVNGGAPVSQAIPASDAVIPGPALDAAVGVYSGFPLGVTRVGGIDALISMAYLPVPSSGETDFSVPDGTTRFGFGARVGILEESILIPAISVAYLQRPLPAISWRATADEGFDYGVDDLEIDVATWRVVASKSFLLFDLSGGFGGDTYRSSGRLSASSGPASEQVSVERDVRRSTWFVGLTFGLGPLKVGAEVGRVSGGEVGTFNTFHPAADAARTFASLGVRFGL